jgi:hypothetical protein
MNPELIVAALLADPVIYDLVGDRVALAELPEGTEMPAIVYNLVTGKPTPNVDDTDRPRARVQINPIAPTIGEVKELHARVREVFKAADNSVVAGKLVASCRMTGFGPVSRDDITGNWTQPVDYLLIYNE